MNAILAMATKDLRLLMRDVANAFFTFVFPLFVAILFGSIFGGGDHSSRMEIAVVNEGGGAASVSLVADLKADEALDVTTEATGADKQARRLTRAEGESLVRSGKIAACVVIPADFDAGLTGMFAGKGMRVEAVVDPARKAEAGLLTGKLNELAFRQMAKSFSNTGQWRDMLGKGRQWALGSSDLSPAQKDVMSKMFDSVDKVAEQVGGPPLAPDGPKKSDGPGWRPVNVEIKEIASKSASPRTGYEISFGQGVVWGLVGCVMAFGVSLVSERGQGTLLRLTTAPISWSQILVGKAAACFITCTCVQILLVAFGEVVYRAFGSAIFRVRVPDMTILAAAILATSIGFTGLMMLLAGIAAGTEGAAQGLGRAVVLILAIIGGGSVPLFVLPETMRRIAGVSPFRWANLAMERATWRESGWGDMVLPLGVLLAMGASGFLIGTLALKRSRRM